MLFYSNKYLYDCLDKARNKAISLYICFKDLCQNAYIYLGNFLTFQHKAETSKQSSARQQKAELYFRQIPKSFNL